MYHKDSSAAIESAIEYIMAHSLSLREPIFDVLQDEKDSESESDLSQRIRNMEQETTSYYKKYTPRWTPSIPGINLTNNY